MNNRFLNLANNNFDILDLGAPPRLTRTYKAYCPICLFRLETTDPNKRDIYCSECHSVRVSYAIKIQRWYKTLICVKEYKSKLISKELMYRKFFRLNIHGFGLAHNICKYL